MPSAKKLSGLCHNIAHHAVSGLSFVHPHVVATCRSGGLDFLSVDLLQADPCPERFRDVTPLRLSLRALKSKLESMLASEGFSLSDLAAAELTFRPFSKDSDDYSSVCYARLRSKTGHTYEHVVDCSGESRSA
jgi:hypothetical protein